MHEAAADCPTVTDGKVPDLGGSAGQERLGSPGFRRVFDLTMSGQGTEAKRTVLSLDERQVGESVQVDQRADLGYAQVEQRNKALPPGKELSALITLSEERECFLDRAWAGVG